MKEIIKTKNTQIISAILITALLVGFAVFQLTNTEDTSVDYEKEIAALEKELDAKDERLDSCIKVVDGSIMANAYFLLVFVDSADTEKYYELASQQMNEYDSDDTDNCRGD